MISTEHHPKKGVLLLNVGSPDDPSPKSVGRYLRQFLMDKYILDIPYITRFFLVHALIVPKRKKSSAELYQKIWDEKRGSPLIYSSQDLAAGIQKKLGGDYSVALGMAFGAPSIDSAVKKLIQEGVTKIFIFPQFPQWAQATTQSVVECVYKFLDKNKFTGESAVLDSFYEDELFIEALAANINTVLDQHQPDHLLMSYHGLPEKQILKIDDHGHCLKSESCCDVVFEKNRNCYRAQCFETTNLLKKKLNGFNKVSTAFQSRLGKTKWIEPYTEDELIKLAKKGIKKLAIACPSFTVDCLETLEEIHIRAKEVFLEAGGKEFIPVPCLNADELWVNNLTEMIQKFISTSEQIQPAEPHFQQGSEVEFRGLS